MKATYIEEFGNLKNIKIGDLPIPKLENNEVCVAVAYAGVNPVDWKIAEGLLTSRLPHQFPLVLGWEAAGRITKIGQDVSYFKVGDEVYLYCRKPTMQWGSFAEYLNFPAEHVALKPKNLTMAQAAVVPLAGLTAWEALFDKMDLRPKEKVLIHAGAGGVGGFAIQWAKQRGALVITTASHTKFDYVEHLGADEIIDYQKVNFVEQISKMHPMGVDVVFDTVGGEVYRKSFDVLKPKGRLVSILEKPNADLAKKYHVKADYLFVEPSGKHLQEIAKLFEEGRVITPQIHEFSLENVIEALSTLKEGHIQGKVVLRIN